MESPENPDMGMGGEPPAPDPTPDPTPEPPTEKVISVNCGNPNCQAHFDFPVQTAVNGFTFNCGECGALNTWEES